MHKALLCAFPTWSALEQMLVIGAGWRLEVIAGRGSLSNMAFELIEQIDARGEPRILVDVAAAARCGNPQLRRSAEQFARAYAQSIAPPVSGAGTASRRPLSCVALIDLLVRLPITDLQAIRESLLQKRPKARCIPTAPAKFPALPTGCGLERLPGVVVGLRIRSGMRVPGGRLSNGDVLGGKSTTELQIGVVRTGPGRGSAGGDAGRRRYPTVGGDGAGDRRGAQTT